MSSMLRMLLRTSYPIEKLSLKLGIKVDICRWPWIRIGLKRQSFLSDVGPPLCLMAAACRARPLFCLDLPKFLGCLL